MPYSGATIAEALRAPLDPDRTVALFRPSSARIFPMKRFPAKYE